MSVLKRLGGVIRVILVAIWEIIDLIFWLFCAALQARHVKVPGYFPGHDNRF